MDKLLKQLKRDLKKNPKKAGMLCVLFLGLLYSCLPFILPAEKKPVKKTAVAAVAAVAVPGTPAAAAAAPVWRWQDLDKQLKHDPRMQSAVVALDSTRRNPFAAEVAVVDPEALKQQQMAELAAAEAAAKAIAPTEISAALQALPLSLSSTIVAGARSRAVINGRVFEQGATMGLHDEQPIIVQSIEPRRVVIEWNGSRRELRILRPGETPPESLATGPLGSAAP